MKALEFVKRNKFLVGVAVLVLAGVATIVGPFMSLRKANAGEVAALVGKEQSLSQYAAKPDMHNKADVPEVGKLAQAYESSLDEVRAQLAKQDQPLEEPLKEQPRNVPATDGSTWKLVYGQDVQNLLDKLQKSFLIVADNPIVAQQYGDEIPDDAEMAQQTRYLHVQQYAIDAIASLNAGPNARTVPVFNGFSFLSQPERLLSSAHGQEFTPIPFQIRLSTDFTNIPRVLYSLLKSPLQFEITSISIARPDRLDRGSPAKKAWAARIQPGQTAAPKLALAPKPTPARPTTPAPTAALPFGGGAPPPGFGPSAEEINRMIEEQRAAAEAAAKEQEKIMMEAMNRARGMTNAPGTMPGATAPSSAARRMRSALTTKGTTVTEDIKAQLPKTLVDLTIRGYVADYKEKKTTN